MWSSSMRWLRPAIRQIPAPAEAGPSMPPRMLTQAKKISTTTVVHEEEEGGEEGGNLQSSLGPLISSPSSSPRRGTGTRTRFGSELKRSEPYILHVQSTRNNTIMTLTTPQGNPVTHVSTGMLGFKKSARSGYEAGHQTAMKMFNVIEENRLKWRVANLHLIFNGFGTGRDAVYRALLTQEGTNVRNLVKKMSDATRIKIGGVRPKKRRML